MPPSRRAAEFLPRELNLFWGENYLVTIHRECRRRAGGAGGSAQALGAARGAPALTASRVWRTRSSRAWSTATSRCRTGFASGSKSIEEAIFTGAEGAAADLFRLRKELLRVPRLLAPTSHVLAEVLRRERAIPDGLRPYFADVQDHALHVLAELDTYRDLLGAALDVTSSTPSTGWASS